MAQETHRIKLCPDCGVDNPAVCWRCWICSCDLRNQKEIILTAEILDEPEAPPIATRMPVWAAPARHSVLPAIWLSALTAVVGMGLLLHERWLLVPYVIVVGPVFFGLLIEHQRRSKQRGATFLDAVLSVVLSAVMIFTGLIVVLAAAVVALVLLCVDVLR